VSSLPSPDLAVQATSVTHNRVVCSVLLCLALLCLCACSPAPTPTVPLPTNTAAPSPTPTATLTPTPTRTPTATPLPLAVSVEIDPLRPIQGGVLLVKLGANQTSDFILTFDGKALPVAHSGDHYGQALVGLHVCEPPASHVLQVEASAPSGQRVSVRSVVSVGPGEFDTEWLTIPADRLALLDPEISAPEARKVAEVCSTFSPDRTCQGPFEVPWSGKVNSPFGARRSYAGEPPTSCHTGMDIDGEGGEPVRAANAGIVALAEELSVRGNAVILDHGSGIFSGYWHLAELLVEPGDSVVKGQIIGHLGSTGLSTGAHLHWEMRVHNVCVDPLVFTGQGLSILSPDR